MWPNKGLKYDYFHKVYILMLNKMKIYELNEIVTAYRITIENYEAYLKDDEWSNEQIISCCMNTPQIIFNKFLKHKDMGGFQIYVNISKNVTYGQVHYEELMYNKVKSELDPNINITYLYFKSNHKFPALNTFKRGKQLTLWLFYNGIEV